MTDGGVAAARGGTLPEDQVRAMFDRIARVYDLLNSVMTVGLHHRWRERAADLAAVGSGDRVLDVATGTGDLAIELEHRVGSSGEVVGADFSEGMLELAREKAPHITFEAGNALDLSYEDDSFDAATVGFGARNFSDLPRGLSEMARVVRPGGRVVVLEITTPQRPPLSWFFRVWFDRLVPLIGRAAGTLAAGGKRLRPVLVYVSAGDSSSDALVEAAVAIELLHMATLVHDDVLDGASLRRGRPTVFATGGRSAATATGDLLFSRAFAVLAAVGNADAVRALSDASSALAHGELMQRQDAWSADVRVDRYLERCRLKTARLFEAACRLGALLGEPGPAAATGLGAYGDRIGVAFQIFDDVLDVSGPTERTGKLRGADLLDGTVTLPLILARRLDPELARLH